MTAEWEPKITTMGCNEITYETLEIGDIDVVGIEGYVIAKIDHKYPSHRTDASGKDLGDFYPKALSICFSKSEENCKRCPMTTCPLKPQTSIK